MVVFSKCMDCKHLHERMNDDTTFYCSAYPEGIPEEVLWDRTGNLCSEINADGIHFANFYIEEHKE